MEDYVQLAAALRQQRQSQEEKRRLAASQGGAAGNTAVGSQTMSGAPQQTALNGQISQQQQPQQTDSPLSQAMDGYSKYLKAKDMFTPAAGSSLGATGTAYAGSGLAGTGYGLGGSLVAGGGSGAGAGAGLGSMLGSYGASTAPSSFGALGGTTASAGLGGTFGGGAAGSAGGGAAAGGGAGAGLAGAGGMLAGLAALGFLGDKEMNESKGSAINADKINNMGTIGDSGIGLRGGDLVNGFNPGTWASDPMKAGKALVNVFTLGFLDKWL